jgi:hypothetical protein
MYVVTQDEKRDWISFVPKRSLLMGLRYPSLPVMESYALLENAWILLEQNPTVVTESLSLDDAHV